MKAKQTAVIFVLMIVLSVLLSKNYQIENKAVHTVAKDQIENNSMEGSIKDQIQNIEYQKNGIYAAYPRLVEGGSEEELKVWNRLIQEDFEKILKIYSFYPFPQLTPVPADQVPVYLKINYNVGRNDDKIISIVYTVNFNSSYSAHPTELIYTTNIDKIKNKRISLTDIVNADEAFLKDFRNWMLLPVEGGNEEFNQAIADYVKNLSDEDLMTGFQHADIIGSGNTWGVFSYFTKDSLGISLGAPHYIGDHVEFEMKYADLQNYLKSDYKE